MVEQRNSSQGAAAKALSLVSLIMESLRVSSLDSTKLERLLNRSDVFAAKLGELVAEFGAPNKYDKERGPDPFKYSTYRRPNSLMGQLGILREEFPHLGDFTPYPEADFPHGAEGLGLFPRWQLLGNTYEAAVLRVLSALAARRFEAVFSPSADCPALQQSAQLKASWKRIEERQTGDFLVMPVQFGARYGGCSARCAVELMQRPEFALGAYAVGILLLTHPTRLRPNCNDPVILCAGDECREISSFPNAPCGFTPAFVCDTSGSASDDDCVKVTSRSSSTVWNGYSVPTAWEWF